jgi:hypothetical protein
LTVLHEAWYVWIDYFWSSLKGNGPEALIQTVVYGAIAAAIYPPFRDYLKKESEKMHGRLTDLEGHIKRVHRHLGIEPVEDQDVPPLR